MPSAAHGRSCGAGQADGNPTTIGAIATTAKIAAAAAYVASGGFAVAFDGARGIVVPYACGRSSGDPHDWCAAGDFAIRSLRLRPGTRIFRLTPPPVRQAGVRFSLTRRGRLQLA